MMKKGFWFRSLRVFVVLLISVLAAVFLVKMKPQAARQERVDTGRLVEAIRVAPETLEMRVETYGTVRPAHTVRFVSEVRGEILALHPSFIDGGYLPEGAHVLTIDPRLYRLEVERRRVQTAQIEAEKKRVRQEIRNLTASIEIAKSDLRLAKAEFDRLAELSERKVTAQTTRDQAEQRYLTSLNRLQSLENQLALTGPVLEQLSAQKQMAEVGLKQAGLDLENTRIMAPFDCRVTSKNVEIGQFVPVGQVLGAVYRDGQFEIEANIPVKELQWLPSVIDSESGLAATVLFRGGHFEESPLKWQGRLKRLKAGMDERTRTLPAVVEIDAAASSGAVQDTRRLRPGMFVTVQVMGKKIEGVYCLPRHVVHTGDVVYLAKENRLALQKVHVFRLFKDTAYIDEGLTPEDRIVVTAISSAVDGMKIRVKEAGQ